jgi:hypothetical protein
MVEHQAGYGLVQMRKHSVWPRGGTATFRMSTLAVMQTCMPQCQPRPGSRKAIPA